MTPTERYAERLRSKAVRIALVGTVLVVVMFVVYRLRGSEGSGTRFGGASPPMPPPSDPPSGGVREPRRPLPPAGPTAAALPMPAAEFFTEPMDEAFDDDLAEVGVDV